MAENENEIDEKKEEARKEILSWKSGKSEIIQLPEFRTPRELINVLLKTDQYSGLMFYGEGGIGKTILTLAEIKNSLQPEEWEYSNGYTTPLALYEFLYRNRHKKMIVLDDNEGTLSNPLSLAILKGATWETHGKRVVQYSSKSEKLEVPERFMMGARIIILCNVIPKENDISMRAMLSRMISYKMLFSFAEKMRICKAFIDVDPGLSEIERDLLKQLIHENVTPATKDFSFRTLRKATAFVKYDQEKAEKLFQETTETDELKAAYLEACRQSRIVKFQAKHFTELTGKSRRTFFNVKKSMSAEVQ